MKLLDSSFNHLGTVPSKAASAAARWRSRPEVTHVDVVSANHLVVFYRTVTNGLGVREVYVP